MSRLSAATPEDRRLPVHDAPAHAGHRARGRGASFVIADLPGLIPGAAEGKGLGHRFLRHTERTRLLLHLIDLDPDPGRDPVEDYRIIQKELAAYSEDLAGRPQIVAGNKIELPGAEERYAPRSSASAPKRDSPCLAISAVTGRGLPRWSPMSRRLAEMPR